MRAISARAIGPTLPYPVYDGFVDLTKETPASPHPLSAGGGPDLGSGPSFYYGFQWLFFAALFFGFWCYFAWTEYGLAKRSADASASTASSPRKPPRKPWRPRRRTRKSGGIVSDPVGDRPEGGALPTRVASRTRKRCVIYTRVSRDDTGEGRSNERQEEVCRKLADLRGWEVVSVEADISVSAYSGTHRPAWQSASWRWSATTM